MEGKHDAHAVLCNELENIIICKYRLVFSQIKNKERKYRTAVLHLNAK